MSAALATESMNGEPRSEPGAWVYVAFLVSCLALGAFGMALRRRPAATRLEPGPDDSALTS